MPLAARTLTAEQVVLLVLLVLLVGADSPETDKPEVPPSSLEPQDANTPVRMAASSMFTPRLIPLCRIKPLQFSKW
uniref:Uncharacterized protein n=1 Tax=Ralstonia syzygii R24 TaxID=907261 RepID=G3A282_9RALS|nr:conserved hypothetical protein [Ralstonia syzygii R24]